MPLPSIEKHVLQLSVASKYGIRGERLCEIEAIVYVVAHLFAAPLAKVEHFLHHSYQGLASGTLHPPLLL